MRVSIIDYKTSNLHSVKAACEEVGISSRITSKPNELLSSDAAILPGVGSFSGAMENIRKLGLEEAILNFVSSGKSLFGVCLGQQLLFEQSEEFGTHEGLSLLRGKVKKFYFSNENNHKYPVPQIGWNKIISKNQSWKGTFLDNCDEGTYMYFVHSFYVEPEDEAVILSTSVYGNQRYCSSIKNENIFATQFHPEKSGHKGLEIYRSFKNYLNINGSMNV